MKKVLICVGTRPNFIKVTQFKKRAWQIAPDIQFDLLHTGQHFDEKMSQVFFDQLQLARPDFFLGVNGHSQIGTIAKIMESFEDTLLKTHYDMVLVPGDVNSSLACAIVASRHGIPLGHIESGLRSRDRGMPEEINRILIDDLSDLLFVSEESGLRNLQSEGKSHDRIYHVGNTMIDSLAGFKEEIANADLGELEGTENYALVTFHRPSNVDHPETIDTLVIPTIKLLADRLKVIFPVHPRTRSRLNQMGYWEQLNQIQNLKLSPPLGYLEFQKLLSRATVVITDSGGIQEETTYLGIPCITARSNTERPSTIELGSNTLAGTSCYTIIQNVELVLNGTYKKGKIPPKWDGLATNRIITSIQEFFA